MESVCASPMVISVDINLKLHNKTWTYFGINITENLSTIIMRCDKTVFLKLVTATVCISDHQQERLGPDSDNSVRVAGSSRRVACYLPPTIGI